MRRSLLLLSFMMLMAVVNTSGQEFQDTIRYVQYKEQLLGTSNFYTFGIWKADAEAISQTFLLNGASLTIKGVEFHGNRSADNSSGTVTVRASVYAVDANNSPTSMLASGTATISSTTNAYHYVNFSTPLTVTSNYAIVVEPTNTNGVFDIYVTNYNPALSYQESLARFRSSYYPKSASAFVTIPTLTTGDATNFPQGTLNFEPLIAPIVAYTPTVQATVPAVSTCYLNEVAVAGTGAPVSLLTHRMYNYDAFKQYFGIAGARNIESWDMGDGKPFVEKASHNYRYHEPGTYTATYYYSGGLMAGFIRSVEKSITVWGNTAPAIAAQPAAVNAWPNDPASFSVSAPTATSFQWQLNTGSGFVNIADGNGWSGATTPALSLSSYPAEMDGAQVRCLISGECTETIPSNAVSITTRTKLPQIITFASTRAAVYGDAGFAPGAGSTSAFSISYTSSNENVATIENGLVHIKGAGTTTITASLPGDDDYLPAMEEQLLTVSQKNITLTLQATPAIAKVYDGTAGASLAAANYSLQGVLPGDEVGVTGTASYAVAAAAASTTITVGSFVLSGAQKANYQLMTTTATVAGQITQKDITLSINTVPAIGKIYDGNTSATLVAGNYNLQGVITGDAVTVAGTASYDNASAGGNKTVTVGSLSLSGAGRANYHLVTNAATVTGTILQKNVSLSLNTMPAITKTYDGNNDASLAAANYNLSGLIPGDEVTVSGTATFNNAQVGAIKTIAVGTFVLSGAQHTNYRLSQSTASTSGAITPKEVEVTLHSILAISKVYDGNTAAVLAPGNYSLQGLVTGDDVSLTFSATYADGLVAENKTVTVDQMALAGEQKDNYHLITSTATIPGTITPKELVVALKGTTAFSKVYDGSTATTLPAGSLLLSGIVGSDVVEVAGTAVFDNGQAGSQQSVSVASLTLSGQDAGNYRIPAATVLTASGTISPKSLSVMADSHTKTYGATDPILTYQVAGLIGNDGLTGSLMRAAGTNVGTYAIGRGDLSGGDNYTIVDFAGADLTITPAKLTITTENKSRKQGAGNPAFTFLYDGFVQGQGPADLSVQPQAQTIATTNSPIGNYPIIVSSAAADNYTISMIPGILTVLPEGNNLFKAWKSGPGLLQVRVYSETARPANIRFTSATGQAILLRQVQLTPGINSFELAVGTGTSGIYIIQVNAGKDKEAASILF